VKTRLIGTLTAEEAAELHAAFLGDVLDVLRGGRFRLQVAWALAPGEEPPASVAVEGFRQRGEDLGARLYHGLDRAARGAELVAAVGSDHPELTAATVEEAFRRLAAGAEVVLGPADDGGYYLIGLRRRAIRRELFDGVPWSTGEVLERTLERCRRLGLRTELLATGRDVDVADDLRRLARRLAAGGGGCPRTRALLAEWGWIPTQPKNDKMGAS
jgi:hypothetical protein